MKAKRNIKSGPAHKAWASKRMARQIQGEGFMFIMGVITDLKFPRFIPVMKAELVNE